MDDAGPEGEPFEGVDIDTPIGRIRMGRGPGREFQFEVGSADDAYRRARRRVRRRLRFFRHLTTYLLLNLIFFGFDALTGGGYWVQWVAGIWGVFIAWDFLSAFVFPNLFGSEAERRMIERELRRQQSAVKER